MRLLSVNIGKARRIGNGAKSAKTGIFKQPSSGPVLISYLGIAGDEVCNTRHHGGVDQAMYIYGSDDYAWWEKELGKTITPGTFGDNLTFSNMESASYQIGDRFTIGEVILEVTAPRIPCGTLASHMGDPHFVKQFQQAERPGLYCRVIKEGSVTVSDEVAFQSYDGETVTAIEMFRNYYRKDQNEDTLRRYLAAPIAVRARVDMEQRLQKLLEQNA